MTNIEAAEIVLMLMGAYAREMSEPTRKVYQAELEALDVHAARGAVQDLIRSSKFLPSIAEMREAAAHRLKQLRDEQAKRERRRALPEPYGGAPVALPPSLDTKPMSGSFDGLMLACAHALAHKHRLVRVDGTIACWGCATADALMPSLHCGRCLQAHRDRTGSGAHTMNVEQRKAAVNE